MTPPVVSSLLPGDVVEARRAGWPAGQKVVGPVTCDGRALVVAEFVVGWLDGGELDEDKEVVVLERAPRPLYCNHSRTEPVAGDVVRVEFDQGPADDYVDVYDPVTAPGAPWLSLVDGSRYTTEQAIPSDSVHGRALLLVDGETLQVVPE